MDSTTNTEINDVATKSFHSQNKKLTEVTSIVGGRETGEMCLYLECKNKDIGKT